MHTQPAPVPVTPPSPLPPFSVPAQVTAAAGPYVSMELKKGFAFVTYINVFEAEAALKKLRGRIIDGTAIAVEVAGKKDDKRTPPCHSPPFYSVCF